MLMLKTKKFFTLLISFVLLFNVTANADSAYGEGVTYIKNVEEPAE